MAQAATETNAARRNDNSDAESIARSPAIVAMMIRNPETIRRRTTFIGWGSVDFGGSGVLIGILQQWGETKAKVVLAHLSRKLVAEKIADASHPVPRRP